MLTRNNPGPSVSLKNVVALRSLIHKAAFQGRRQCPRFQQKKMSEPKMNLLWNMENLLHRIMLAPKQAFLMWEIPMPCKVVLIHGSETQRRFTGLPNATLSVGYTTGTEVRF